MNSSLLAALDDLRLNPRFAGQISAWQHLPAREGRHAPLPGDLPQPLVQALHARGIDQLYKHQAEAITEVLAGKHVTVATGPASGKTLCYNLPVLTSLLLDPAAHALYLFPTKALAHDQLTAWQTLAEGLLPNAAAAYDGDTPSSSRTAIRNRARVLFTNPDMLHAGILPHHTKWREWFAHLRYVVLDEMHVYRGIFGSHVANVLRRMERICRFYGSAPQFITCSATIANPGELAQRLIGQDVVVIDDDASPQGDRHLLLYNPPLIDAAHGVRRSMLLEAQAVIDLFLAHDVATIAFCQGRLGTELLLTYVREAQTKRGAESSLVRGYRGGYLPRERRAIEQGLRRGTVRGVVSTNALELGIDIGELSACVLAGYPGSIASTRQQAGRAGRRCGVSAAVLIGSSSPLDQYLLSHPEFVFSRSPEHALIAPDNPHLLCNHLQCAAFELPVVDGETYGAQADAGRVLARIEQDEGNLRHANGRWFWMSAHYPAQAVSLRAASADSFVVTLPEGEIIAQVDKPSAPLLIHPGAIYLHDGQAYLIEELDWEERMARARAVDLEYYTRAGIATEIEVLDTPTARSTDTLVTAHGNVRLRLRPSNYQRVALHTGDQLAVVPLDLPEQTMLTTAYWMAIPEATETALRDLGDWTVSPIHSYGPNWQEQRRKARERDGYRCRLCGRPEPAHQEHHVHHMRPFRLFDYRPGKNAAYILANRLSNLITLCPDCHPVVEATHAVQDTWEGVGHLLGALAPLYLMCDRHDLRVTVDLDFAYTRSPAILLYDAIPGGVGLAQALYDLNNELLLASLEWVKKCPCEEGCPACIGAPPQTGAGAKRRVQQALEFLLKHSPKR